MFKLYEDDNLQIIINAYSEKSMKELVYELKMIADKLVESIEKSNETPSEQQESIEESKETKDNETASEEQESYDSNPLNCRFCSEPLNFCYDKDEMYHCQVCHNVYDGFAQCQH